MVDEAWRRLGRALVKRRVELGYRTRAGFLRAKDATGFDRIASDLEAGNRDNYERSTLAYVEMLYELQPDAVSRLLGGDDDASTSLPSPPQADVADVVRQHPRLTDQQKETLIMLFEKFVADTDDAVERNTRPQA